MPQVLQADAIWDALEKEEEEKAQRQEARMAKIASKAKKRHTAGASLRSPKPGLFLTVSAASGEALLPAAAERD